MASNEANEANDGIIGGSGRRVLQQTAWTSDGDTTKRSDSSIEDRASGEDAGDGSSTATQDAAIDGEEEMSERRRSKMPVPSPTEEVASRQHSLDLAAAAQLAELNTKRNKAGKKAPSRSGEFKAGLRGEGGSDREKSVIAPLKSLGRLFRSEKSGPQVRSTELAGEQSSLQATLRLFAFWSSGRAVNFKKQIGVRRMDCSPDGDPPAVLPQIPVVTEEIRQEGVVLNEEERKAVKLQKGRQAYTADFERRMANSRQSSSTSQGRSSSHGGALAVIDELERLQLDRGRLPTNRERRTSAEAGPSSEHSSLDRENVSPPRSNQSSEESTTDCDSPAERTGQTLEGSSTSEANSSSHTQASQVSESTNQAINHPSTQYGGAIQQPPINQENVAPSPQAGPSVETLSNLNTAHHAPDSGNEPKAPDDKTNFEHVVRAQLGIIYDQDPSIAIQSLDNTSGLLRSTFAPQNFDAHISPTDIYIDGEINTQNVEVNISEDALLEQPHGQCVERNDITPQKCGIFSLNFIAYFLDEFGNALYPEATDKVLPSEAEHSAECTKGSHPDRIIDSLLDEQTVIKPSRHSHAPAQAAENNTTEPIKSMTRPARKGSRLCCHIDETVAQSSLENEELVSCALPSPSLHQTGALSVSGESYAVDGYQPTLCDLGVGLPIASDNCGNDVFGTALEKAYNVSCSTNSPSKPFEALLPLNVGQIVSSRPMDDQIVKPCGTSTASMLPTETDLDPEEKLLRLVSWLNPPAKHSPAVNSETKGSLEYLWPCKEATFEETSPFIRSPTPGPEMLADHTSSGTMLNDLYGDTDAAFENSLRSMHPFYEEPGSKEASTSLLQAWKRSNSSLSASSRTSIVTALNDLEFAGSKASIRSASSLTNNEGLLFDEHCRSDSECDHLDQNAVKSWVHSPGVNDDSRSGSSNPLLKRVASSSTNLSALSIITSFTSCSATSKASIHSGSSSGSSGSSSLRFGRCGDSRRWTPRTSKSQASVCIDKNFGRLPVNITEDTGNISPAGYSGRPRPTTETMRKFVMRYPATQPDRCARSTAKRLEVRKVIQKRPTPEHMWNSWFDRSEVHDGETVPYEVLDALQEAEEQSVFTGNAASLSATEDSDMSPPSESMSFGDED